MRSQGRLQLVEYPRVFEVVRLVRFDEVDEAFCQRNFASKDVLKVTDDVLAADGELRHHPIDLRLFNEKTKWSKHKQQAKH